MEKVFPEQMDAVSYDDIKSGLKVIEDYVRYMRERVEFAITNVSKTAIAAGSYSYDYVLRLRQAETDIQNLRTSLVNNIATANRAISTAEAAETNSENALNSSQELYLKMPFSRTSAPDSSTVGTLGQICIVNNSVYICTAAVADNYVWKEVQINA